MSRAEALSADVVTKIRPFTPEEIGSLKRGATTVSLLAPVQNKAVADALAAQGVTALGLDCVPRTLSRAQAFDVLSSQANIAGFRAVMEAAHALPRRARRAARAGTRHPSPRGTTRAPRRVEPNAATPQLTRAACCRAPGRQVLRRPVHHGWCAPRAAQASQADC